MLCDAFVDGVRHKIMLLMLIQLPIAKYQIYIHSRYQVKAQHALVKFPISGYQWKSVLSIVNCEAISLSGSSCSLTRKMHDETQKIIYENYFVAIVAVFLLVYNGFSSNAISFWSHKQHFTTEAPEMSRGAESPLQVFRLPLPKNVVSLLTIHYFSS